GRFKILGFNRQWTQSGAGRPFLFAGAASHAELAAPLKNAVTDALNKLIGFYDLKGLGSIDFIVLDGQCYILEINARPPASAQLYGKTVFSAHVRACLGNLADNELVHLEPMAYQIIYARDRLRIPEAMHWPDWARDIPDNGVNISPGLPICSIIARGNSSGQLFELLEQRRRFIENILNIGS
ncbi:MAG: ATP-grasp domain-containing protein, partial [Methylomonas sp.]